MWTKVDSWVMKVRPCLGWIMQLTWNLWFKIRVNQGATGTSHWNVPWLTSPVFSGHGSSSVRRTWSAPPLIQRGGDRQQISGLRPLSRLLPHHHLHPHFTSVSVIDGNVLAGLAPCRGTPPRARTPWGGGVEESSFIGATANHYEQRLHWHET